MTNDILTNAMEDVMQSVVEQQEQELLGAWRAGYDYVHVYSGAPELARGGVGETYTVRRYTLPTNQRQPPRPESRRYKYTYELRDVTREELEEVGAFDS